MGKAVGGTRVTRVGVRPAGCTGETGTTIEGDTWEPSRDWGVANVSAIRVAGAVGWEGVGVGVGKINGVGIGSGVALGISVGVCTGIG